MKDGGPAFPKSHGPVSERFMRHHYGAKGAVMNELIVTRNGIPVADQEQGIREFKEACLRKPHTGREPMDCTSDLRLLWRGDVAGFSGYDYHTPDRVADTVLREIAYLRVRAERMEEWLRAYSAQRVTATSLGAKVNRERISD